VTLRSRFTLAVAGAVAAVALAITAVAFLVVRSDLTGQVQQELRQKAAVVQRLARHYHGQIPAGWCRRTPTGSAGRVRTRRW
jgi:two-component system, OmpR family, sensor histidine kinase MprB